MINSTTKNAIAAMEKAGIDPKINEDGTGKMFIPGLGDVTFSCGDENFYFQIPDVYVKSDVKKVLDILIKLGDVVRNYS